MKKVWHSLYRAVDAQGNILEFFLSTKRDAHAAKQFFWKALNACHTVTSRMITADKNAAQQNGEALFCCIPLRVLQHSPKKRKLLRVLASV